MFSCEYCKTFKNNYFEEHLRAAATVIFLFSRTPKRGCLTLTILLTAHYLSVLFALIWYIFRFLVFHVLYMRSFQMKIKAIKLIIQSRYAVVCNAHFHHQDHLDFVKHLINVLMICIKRFILIVNGWLSIKCLSYQAPGPHIRFSAPGTPRQKKIFYYLNLLLLKVQSLWSWFMGLWVI